MSFPIFVLLAATASAASSMPSSTQSNKKTPTVVEKPSFSPFTGAVAGERVRIRLSPSLDSPVLTEYSKGELLAITGESDDFYAIAPSEAMKCYVFRTYVLDGLVEGQNVNVRLSPDKEAPIIAQLHAGDKIDGVISAQNNKWIEIDPPASTRFYIAKEYVQRVGDESFFAKAKLRKEGFLAELSSVNLMAAAELGKEDFSAIDYGRVASSYEKLLKEYADYQEASDAKMDFDSFKETFIQRKIAYVEKRPSMPIAVASPEPTTPVFQAQNPSSIAVSERIYVRPASPSKSTDETIKTLYEHFGIKDSEALRTWGPVEWTHYSQWKESHPSSDIVSFYNEALSQAQTIRGTITPYSASVKNKPGDFLLERNGQPRAYLYSTHLSLSELIGKDVELKVVERPNNNFAYPAYFVIEVR